MKTFTVHGNDRASATTGHGEAFEIEVQANNPTQADARARQARRKLDRHHILIGLVIEKAA